MAFTLTEYIQQHALNVSPLDPRASKLINEHLKAQGFVRIRRNNKWIYVRKEEAPDYDALAQRLKGLKP